MTIRYHTREGWARFVGDRVSFTGRPLAELIRGGLCDYDIRKAREDIDLPQGPR